jgi:sterol 3beta-glucosyltransferase
MNIVIVTLGSRGDVQPYIALGLGFKADGHAVTLATHVEFESLIVEYGLDFFAIAGNPGEVVASREGQDWIASGRNPFKFVRRLKRLAEPLMERSLTDIWNACQNADAIIFSPLGFPSYFVAKKLGIPSFGAYLQPLVRSRALPAVAPPAGLNFGPAYNLLSHVVLEQMLWQIGRSVTNRWLQQELHLPPAPLWGPYRQFYRQEHPVLFGFSPRVVPRPPDWSKVMHITGYWFLDHPVDWQPPPDLLDFLESGPPPVYIGFGSMSNRDPAATTDLVLQALARTGQRGVLLTGWGGLSNPDLPDHVFKIESVPHDWLFPQMAAVVHHGGAGTTATSLRAGVPSIVVPFFADQPTWAQRVHALGVGPKPILRSRLTADRLTTAIRTATSDHAMQQRAATLGQQIRAEKGVERAVSIFRQYIATEY